MAKNKSQSQHQQKPEPTEHKAVALSSPPKSAEQAQPSEDRRAKLGRLVEEAHTLASGQGDNVALQALEGLSEDLKTMPLDTQGFDDVERYLRDVITGLQERAARQLETSTLSAEERERLGAGLQALETLAPPLSPVAQAVENLETVAGVERGGAAQALLDSVSDEKSALEMVRRFTRPGEKLVQAIERLEATARRAGELEAEVRRLSMDKGVLLGAQEKANEALLGAEGLRSLVGGDLKARAVGVIVEDVGQERHVVHVLERGGGSLRVWAYDKGEKLPWHAARSIVQALVETKLTPEDKR